MIKKIIFYALLPMAILTLIAANYSISYYIAWKPQEAVVVQYVPDELLWVWTEKGWVTKREPVVSIYYVYSYPNPDRETDILGFPTDRLGGGTLIKTYYEVWDQDKVQEAKMKANQWLQTNEGKEAVEKAKQQFHKK